MRAATTADDRRWEQWMRWTTVADRTTWTPDEQDNLPWRYRENVLAAFGLLDEVRGQRQQATPL